MSYGPLIYRSAPKSSKIRQVSTCPRAAAQNKGGMPDSPVKSRSAPYYLSAAIICAFPIYAARVTALVLLSSVSGWLTRSGLLLRI